ncbi:MAG: hypothetical protein RLZZ519_1623 [Bacteroidota bacterium]|jgi:hypothetical protein
MRIRHSFIALCLLSGLFATSCKEDTDLNPNLITEDYYFQAVLDGDTITYQESKNDYYNIVGDFYGAEADNGWCYVPFTCLAKNAASTNPNPTTLAKSGAVGIIGISPGQILTQSAYETLVTTGTLQIGRVARDISQTAVAGAFVSIMDADGVEWNTDNGPLGNGSVVINEYADFVDNERIPATHKVIAASFTCTVYNAAGESKAVTGGKIRGRLVRW